MADKPEEFYVGDIVRIEHSHHWGKQYMVVAEEFDTSIMEHFITIREIGGEWQRTAEYSKLRYICKKVTSTKLGRLLYGRNT